MQTYWADILDNLNAIYRTTFAFDTDITKLASKPVIEILSISCFVLLLVAAYGYHLRNAKLQKTEMASCKEHSEKN